MRPRLHAPTLIGLVALPLVLSASQVEAQLAASEAAAAARDVAAPAEQSPSFPTTRPPAAVPGEYQVPARPGLGDSRAGEIPWVALQTYRRAADILDEVAPSCGITWAMLAAVGQVESEHGSADGHELGDDGVVRPALVTRGADAAVGPMQLVPGAWRMARVDGDGDGTRSPQDLDDAAVAAGVYLCAAGTDLRTPEGARTALLAYNSSQAYVDRVLGVARRYAQGDYAVAEPPVPQTIGVLLDYGLGTPADDKSRHERPTRPGVEAAEPSPEREHLGRPPVRSGSDPTLLTVPSVAPTDEPTEEPAEEPAGEPTGQTTDEPAAATAEPSTAEGPAPESTEEPAQESTDEPATATGEPSDSDSDSTSTATATAAEEPTQPSTEPSTEPTPDPTPGPTTEITGVWTPCEESFCLDELPLDLTGLGEPTDPAETDLDGDGVVGTLAEELEGLVDREVVLTVVEGSDVPPVLAVRAADA